MITTQRIFNFRWMPLVLLTSFFLPLKAFPESQPAFRDPSQPLENRVADLIGRLTLEEKAMLLNHRGTTVERFNIRADQWNQCLNGVRWDGHPTTLFPSCVGMAATWDPALVHEVASILSDEARAIYNGWHLDPNASGEHHGLIYRAPVINVERNPYWGRNHEAWGEDPYLTGRMGVAYVRGLQGDDPKYLKIAATLKHYAVNNVESGRKKRDCPVSERWLREYWLPHFREAIVEGQAASVMASYNAINGTPNNRNHWLLTDLLKNEWHHDGFVVSDLGGVDTMVKGHSKGQMDYADAVAQSVMAGCDFSDKEYEQYIPNAVTDGKLTEARLNDAVTRVLRIRFRLGEFDPFDSVPYSKIPVEVIGCAKHRAEALKAAQESIVLLQNRDHLLPLDKTKLKRIAVLGPYAGRVVLNSYNGTPCKSVSAVDGIRDRLGNAVEILQENASIKNQEEQSKTYNVKLPDLTLVDKEVELAQKADAVILCVGTDFRIETESRDRKSLGLPAEQEELVKRVLAANPRTIVVQMSAGPLTVPWLKENVPAMLQAWWGGEEGGHGLADVLFGDVNPAGRLPHTVYASESQVPPQDEYDISKGFTYMFVNGAPLFAFGHGLSYTTFEYSDLKVSDSPLKIEATVKNTGSVSGDEVVQLYLAPPDSKEIRPKQLLRGFQRVSLNPGESKRVSFTVPNENLAFWNADEKRFEQEKGKWSALVGASSSDIRLQANFAR